MRPVVCFGEALIDFLNIRKVEDSGTLLDEYRQFPGGAPANAAVAVARLGGQSYFAGQVGSDMFGDFLQNSLVHYQVNTRFLLRHPTAKTALAFVALDDDGDRRFSFYRDKTADVLMTSEQVSENWFSDHGLFHFCSNSLTDTLIAKTTSRAIELARAAQNLISFDVNLRNNLWPNNQIDISLVNEFVYRSDIIKFAKEEIEHLAKDQPIASYIKNCLQHGPRLIVITSGANDIEYYTGEHKYLLSPPKVDAIDTTAGGDAFSGGLLFGLSSLSSPNEIISRPDALKHLIKFAAACGGLAVSRLGAFPALPELSEVNTAWKEFNKTL
jgi:fructokinase